MNGLSNAEHNWTKLLIYYPVLHQLAPVCFNTMRFFLPSFI